MSDEHEDTTWFPRELRDYISAIVALMGFISCGAATFLRAATVPTGTKVSDPAGFIAGGVAGFVGAVGVTVILWRHTTSYRRLGIVPPAALILFVGVGVQSFVAPFGSVDALLITAGFFAGLLGSAVSSDVMRAADRVKHTDGGTGHASRVLWRFQMFFLILLVAQVALVLLVTNGGGAALLQAEGARLVVRYYPFVFAAVLCAWCWLRLFRPFFELCCEPFFRPLYKIRAKGPGVKRVPPLGPVLVISNHAAWFDPVFLGEFIPRPITPLMTESFYNIWFIRPILKYVFRVIVVRETSARREAPELQQAIAALARGECVVLFPEGFLRRKEEMVLRRFAQGIWHILTARPDTPVVACWIEGGWESTFSWRGGPPWKGKRLDIRRPIGVGVNAPEVVPADVLADPMRTRLHLMNRVSAARAHIGLEPLPTFTLPAGGEAEPAQSEQPA